MWWGRWQQWHTFAAWYVGFYNDIISGLWSAALFLGDFFVGWMPHRYYTIRCEQVHWVLNSLSPQSLCHWSCSTLLSRDHAPSERLQQQAYIWCDFIEHSSCAHACAGAQRGGNLLIDRRRCRRRQRTGNTRAPSSTTSDVVAALTGLMITALLRSSRTV